MFIVAVFLLAGAQKKAYSWKDLPLSVRPIALPARFKGKPLVSISELPNVKGLVTRVFRYSYQADFGSVVSGLKKELKGWTLDPGGTEKSVAFEKISNTKKIAYQAVIVNNTRLVRMAGVPGDSMPLWKYKGSGWVWISYNEGYEPGNVPKG